MPDMNSVYINSSERNAYLQLSRALVEKISPIIGNYSDIVIVCVGTDRATGDSLGPLTGHKLSGRLRGMAELYGTLERPVHARNLSETLETIEKKYINPLVIGIDACLGKMSHIGCFSLTDGPLRPGAAVSKDLPEVGRLSVTGIVNFACGMEFMVIQNTRLFLVMKMAEVLANGISHGLKCL